MMSAKVIRCSESLAKRKRVRMLLSERSRVLVVRAGFEAYSEGYLDQAAWTARTRAKLETEFSSVWLTLVVQFVLPILLKWIIDNWST